MCFGIPAFRCSLKGAKAGTQAARRKPQMLRGAAARLVLSLSPALEPCPSKPLGCPLHRLRVRSPAKNAMQESPPHAARGLPPKSTVRSNHRHRAHEVVLHPFTMPITWLQRMLSNLNSASRYLVGEHNDTTWGNYNHSMAINPGVTRTAHRTGCHDFSARPSFETEHLACVTF